MSAEKELIVAPPQENALAVYSADKGLEPWLQKIRVKVDEFLTVVPDLKSVKGRKAITSMAYDIARTKTGLEDAGKAISAEQKKVSGRIDAERKRVWDILESWQKEVRKPLDEWQAVEDKRVEAHNDRLEWLRGLPLNLVSNTSSHVQDLIAQAEAVAIDDQWEEFKAEAGGAKDLALKALRALITEFQRYEAEQAELARLRHEAEERAEQDRIRIAQEAAVEQERQRVAREQQAERDAAARREQALIEQAAQAQRDADQRARDAEAAAANQALQLRLAEEQAERQRLQAESDRVAAAQRAEQERVAAEQRQAEAVERARLAEIARANAAADEINRLAAAREADKAHKGAIYKTAKEAFMQNGMTEDCARLAVKLIASNLIPSISIQY